MDPKQIARVVKVVDTRDYVEVGDRWVPVPGSGQIRQCDRCGRDHEIHAEVEMADGSHAVVGVSCAMGSSVELAVKSGANSAKSLRRLQIARARTAENLLRAHQVMAEVASLAKPAPFYRGLPGSGLEVTVGEHVARRRNTWQTQAQIAQLATEAWELAEMTKRYGSKFYRGLYSSLREELESIDRRIAKVSAHAAVA